MGKSQMIEFTREINKLFQAPQQHRTKASRYRTIQPVQLTEVDISDRLTAFQEDCLITFEMYHRAALKLGFSCSRAQSRLTWILFCNENYGGVRQFIHASEIAMFTVRLYLLPASQGGACIIISLCVFSCCLLGRASPEESIEDALSFRGCLNYAMFRRLVKKLGISISDKVGNIRH